MIKKEDKKTINELVNQFISNIYLNKTGHIHNTYISKVLSVKNEQINNVVHFFHFFYHHEHACVRV